MDGRMKGRTKTEDLLRRANTPDGPFVCEAALQGLVGCGDGGWAGGYSHGRVLVERGGGTPAPANGPQD